MAKHSTIDPAILGQLLALVQTVPVVPAPKATALPAWVTEAKASAPAAPKAKGSEASYKAERSEFNGIPGYTVRKMFGANIARQKFLTDKEVAAIMSVVVK